MNNDKKVIDELDEWVQDLQVRLREATALLVTIRARLISSHPESASDIDAFLSQTPAPAATPALTGAELADRYGFQPHGLASDVAAAMPAPEPSADQSERVHALQWMSIAALALKRAETAEAQLAAVREIAEGWANADDYIVERYGLAILDVLSPGGGTGVDK